MRSTPKILIHLITINVIFFVGTQFSYELSNDLLSLHYFENDKFIVHQVFSHMFMHGSIAHLFFNMFALWMFGSPLVQMWGNNKFLFFYFSSGIGAAIIQSLAYYFNVNSVSDDLLANGVTADEIQNLLISGSYNTGIIEFVSEKRLSSMYYDFNSVMVGASGAIYGIVVAFAFLFPNTRLMLLIPPVPIKAKYLVPLLILGDVFFGFTSASIGNIAHFAHIGGAITGFLMMWYWKRNQFNRNRWN
ncbi:MAG: rhomboid family intramembrane serine protease [Bacteroidota bacterium]|nr:rhomboid family intramembrane serine protease [Bacteroidota bacterium]